MRPEDALLVSQALLVCGLIAREDSEDRGSNGV